MRIEKGDTIICHGIGCPHWKGFVFECTLVFTNGTIGINNAIRVAAKDFRVLNTTAGNHTRSYVINSDEKPS